MQEDQVYCNISIAELGLKKYKPACRARIRLFDGYSTEIDREIILDNEAMVIEHYTNEIDKELKLRPNDSDKLAYLREEREHQIEKENESNEGDNVVTLTVEGSRIHNRRVFYETIFKFLDEVIDIVSSGRFVQGLILPKDMVQFWMANFENELWNEVCDYVLYEDRPEFLDENGRLKEHTSKEKREKEYRENTRRAVREIESELYSFTDKTSAIQYLNRAEHEIAVERDGLAKYGVYSPDTLTRIERITFGAWSLQFALIKLVKAIRVDINKAHPLYSYLSTSMPTLAEQVNEIPKTWRAMFEEELLKSAENSGIVSTGVRDEMLKWGRSNVLKVQTRLNRTLGKGNERQVLETMSQSFGSSAEKGKGKVNNAESYGLKERYIAEMLMFRMLRQFIRYILNTIPFPLYSSDVERIEIESHPVQESEHQSDKGNIDRTNKFFIPDGERYKWIRTKQDLAILLLRHARKRNQLGTLTAMFDRAEAVFGVKSGTLNRYWKDSELKEKANEKNSELDECAERVFDLLNGG